VLVSRKVRRAVTHGVGKPYVTLDIDTSPTQDAPDYVTARTYKRSTFKNFLSTGCFTDPQDGRC
jgi:hypothetical protein